MILQSTALLFLILGSCLLYFSVNVYWVADQFGIHLATGTLRKLIDAVGSGSSLAGAYAAIAGITIPAWAAAAIGAMGATAA
ncbi:class IIc cyclic bacteriocin [Lactobacillus paragasseri]|uniref:class IIc cyclic bacteriocin n=1 Tax=Lactobacillus paragasseri TaxID=2107999 RepID=UPI002074A824|nr:class IIc cyclic bacteriocin [Lactobacillus paragasseri]